MTFEQTMQYIHSFERFGSRPGLERIERLLELLGRPQDKLKIIHVAGTNGKGSITAMTASILKTAGYKTGMYISPFVLDFRERIQLNGEMITKQQLADTMTRLRPMIEQVAGITEFEVITAAALDFFVQESCDVVVLEVGLGGRFDATNVVNNPLVSVIASIGLDHMDILGDTLEKIAFEKCGIIKPGGVTVCYPKQSVEALTVIMEQCAIKGNRLVLPNENSVEKITCGEDGSEIVYEGMCLTIPLLGQHQISNAITAAQTAKEAAKQGLSITDEEIFKGIADVRFPARLEVLCREPLVVLDGAHNPDGAQALERCLSIFGDRPITAVMGVLKDKDSEAELALLAPHFQRIIAVTPQNPRALSGEELALRASKYCKEVVSYGENFPFAFQRASEAASAEKRGMVLIFGSLYMAGEMRRVVLEFCGK